MSPNHVNNSRDCVTSHCYAKSAPRVLLPFSSGICTRYQRGVYGNVNTKREITPISMPSGVAASPFNDAINSAAIKMRRVYCKLRFP